VYRQRKTPEKIRAKTREERRELPSVVELLKPTKELRLRRRVGLK
jgi:hypothetical protein